MISIISDQRIESDILLIPKSKFMLNSQDIFTYNHEPW